MSFSFYFIINRKYSSHIKENLFKINSNYILMCSIIGHLNNSESNSDVLKKGLKKLNHREYDKIEIYNDEVKSEKMIEPTEEN